MASTIIIPERFRGPPDSGHGGWSCGMFATAVAGDAEVTLRAPPPLETALTVTSDRATAEVSAGDLLVATVASCTLDADAMAIPPVPALDAARVAGERSPMLDVDPDALPFSTCFGCGPRRAPGDGLRLWPGRIDDTVAACVWEPDPGIAGSDGTIGHEMVWAALDCPSLLGAWAVLGVPFDAERFVLGRMAASVTSTPDVGEPCILTAWPFERDGRKLHTVAALCASDGRRIGVARATWIHVGGRGAG